VIKSCDKKQCDVFITRFNGFYHIICVEAFNRWKQNTQRFETALIESEPQDQMDQSKSCDKIM